MNWRERIASLLGVSVYQPPHGYGPEIGSEAIAAARKAMGGEIQPIPATRLRWYLADLEQAQAEADAGNLNLAAQLYRAFRRDGVLMGLLAQRTAGLVRLPKRFHGDDNAITDDLQSTNGSRNVFDEMCPPSELASIVSDGICLGVGVGEFVPVVGRDYPVLVRLDPQWLTYVWAESRWYYLSRAGRLPINPGDGRWVLHIPGGRLSPWQWGLWPALGRAFINKEHAISLRSLLIAGVANPAKIMAAPSGATEAQRRAMFRHLLEWGPNMAVEMPPGWDLHLLEMNGGKGTYSIFQQEIDTSDKAYMVALAGQEVTTTGGSGFISGDLFKGIRTDLVKTDAEALSYTVYTQILPQYVYNRFGVDALEAGTRVAWDTNQPKDMKQEAETLQKLGDALTKMGAFFPDLSYEELAERYGIPIRQGAGEQRPQLPAASESPSANDNVIDVDFEDETPADAQAQAMIRKVGDKWVLYTKDGKRRLGTHDTKEGAERQERLIEMKKHNGAVG